MTQEKLNVINQSLVAMQKFIFPSLYIKLMPMMRFVKILNQDRFWFGQLTLKFPGISKKKEEVQHFLRYHKADDYKEFVEIYYTLAIPRVLDLSAFMLGCP